MNEFKTKIIKRAEEIVDPKRMYYASDIAELGIFCDFRERPYSRETIYKLFQKGLKTEKIHRGQTSIIAVSGKELLRYIKEDFYKLTTNEK